MASVEVGSSSARLTLRDSILAVAVDRIIESFEEMHYAQRTVSVYLAAIAHFTQWLERERTGPWLPVRETDVQEFLGTHLAACDCPRWRAGSLHTCRAALRRCVAVLRRLEMYEPTPRPEPTPVEEEVAAFDDYLVEVCGIARRTRHGRKRHVQAFLAGLFGDGPIRYERIGPEEFGLFFTSAASHRRASSLGVIASDLRSYLRFLQFRGQCAPQLVDAVPRVARWRLASLPRHLDDDELRRFLNAFDRRSTRGRRDYSMALCLAILGLRAGEVSGLQLADIDWRVGKLTIAPGKTRRGRILPVCPRLGKAIAAYLKVRPRTTSESLFVHIGAREGKPVATETVRSAIRLAYARAGLSPSYTGTHLLRHTAATRLVAFGATIKEVADVLGHASLDTTGTYAKVDIARLRGVALPWPEAGQ